MAKKSPPKPRTRKPKQGHLPGMEPPSIKEIDNAADELADVRSQRMELSEQEGKLADVLLELMHKHGLKVYEYDSRRVEVAALEKVKVKRQKEESNGEEV